MTYPFTLLCAELSGDPSCNCDTAGDSNGNLDHRTTCIPSNEASDAALTKWLVSFEAASKHNVSDLEPEPVNYHP